MTQNNPLRETHRPHLWFPHTPSRNPHRQLFALGLLRNETLYVVGGHHPNVIDTDLLDFEVFKVLEVDTKLVQEVLHDIEVSGNIPYKKRTGSNKMNMSTNA